MVAPLRRKDIIIRDTSRVFFKVIDFYFDVLEINKFKPKYR
jgi:hypothetical protein